METQGDSGAYAHMERQRAQERFTCPGCGAVSRLEPIARTLTTAAPSWEMWLRARGDEVTAKIRVGTQITERTGKGNVDMTAMLTEAWHAATG
ncbi:hypothetical protein [Sphaerisporangium aureirubrum]|uniref:Uncharacterized protein n=1 Tax=Sphaerisporangium aureirubrum TaxID=1544736 RepID=A0ABW1NL82_9ACTN